MLSLCADRTIDVGVRVIGLGLKGFECGLAIWVCITLKVLTELRSVVPWYVLDEAEFTCEWRNDEGGIVCKGALKDVKALGTCVDKDDAWDMATRFVDDDLRQDDFFEEGVPVVGGAVWVFV